MTRLRLLALLLLVAAAPVSGRTPLYYQDPDGQPAYAAGPSKAADGRAFVPVFADAPAAASPAAGTPTPPSAPASGSNRILFYRNPMGLPDTSPVPKKDSMGMDYIPVRENEAAEAGAGLVTIAPGRMQVLGVRTAPVEHREALARTLRATGTVQFDERGMAVVSTRVGGWIERLEVAATGEAVRRGQVMAEIYAPDLVASEEEYLVASRMGMAAASIQRLRALGVPDDEITRLRRTGKPAQRIPVLAPVDGVVTEKMVVQGTRVGPDQPLFRTARLFPIWVIAEVQEQDLGTVRPGQRAKTAFVAYPGRSFDGTVDFIYPSLTSDIRTGRVRIVIANADEALRAGMFASVEIASPVGEGGPVLTVPSSAILDSGNRQVVLVERGEGRFEPRPVRLGAQGDAQGDGTTEILDGLTTGERVVVGANFLIDAESNLRAALQAFTAGQAGGKPQ